MGLLQHVAEMGGDDEASIGEQPLYERVLGQFVELQDMLDDLERDVGLLIKETTGMAWERIGEAAGITRQAAEKRYVPPEERPPIRRRRRAEPPESDQPS